MSFAKYESLMLKDLARSGLDDADADALRTRPLPPNDTYDLTKRRLPAYRIPYFGLDGRKTKFFRLRSLSPDGGFGEKRDGKYWQPRGSEPRLYLPRSVDWEKIAKDTSIAIAIPEGEKKAACACKHSIMAAATGGAWNFKSKRFDIELLAEFEQFALAGRLIELNPDGDRAYNSNVRAAFREFGYKLTERGAEVCIVVYPPNMKMDDYLLKEGPEGYKRLPREPINPKAQISFVRSRPKMSPRAKHERIAAICENALLANGTAHMVGTEPVIFHREQGRLLSFLVRDDSQLRAFFVNEFGVNPSDHEYRFVYEQVHGYIKTHGQPATTAMFSHFDLKRAELQLSLGGNRVHLITPDGRERVANGHDGVLFRDIAAEPLRFPKGTKASEKAFRYVLGIPNFVGGDRLTVEQEKLLYELHFWSLLFPSYLRVRPLLLLHGPKGSAKSSAGRAIGQALFGRQFDVMLVNPDALGDLDVALTRQPLVVMDNLDGRIKNLENRLATASTGGKISKRVLYTTNDLVEYPIEARVIATSRQPSVFVRDDVRDRTILLPVERRVKFLAESEINARILAGRVGFWKYVFEQLPDIVQALHEHEPRGHEWRLADFAQFCIAAGPVVGYSVAEVEEALDALEGERNQFASNRSHVLEGLQMWALETWGSLLSPGRKRARNEWRLPWQQRTPIKLTSTELFDRVRGAWTRGLFPIHTPEAFGMALRNDAEMLAEHFDVTRDKGHARQTFVVIRPKYDIQMDAKLVGGGGGSKTPKSF